MLRALLRLPSRLLIVLVRGYQLILSPHLGASCRFTPTCSQYAIEALGKYGALKGTILAVHRILRCNPWGGHGHDPPVWYTERQSQPSATPPESAAPTAAPASSSSEAESADVLHDPASA